MFQYAEDYNRLHSRVEISEFNQLWMGFFSWCLMCPQNYHSYKWHLSGHLVLVIPNLDHYTIICGQIFWNYNARINLEPTFGCCVSWTLLLKGLKLILDATLWSGAWSYPGKELSDADGFLFGGPFLQRRWNWVGQVSYAMFAIWSTRKAEC